MRTFGAMGEHCDKYNKKRARLGFARADAARAAARSLSAYLTQRMLKPFRTFCLAGTVATLALAALGAHASRAILDRTGNLPLQQ